MDGPTSFPCAARVDECVSSRHWVMEAITTSRLVYDRPGSHFALFLERAGQMPFITIRRIAPVVAIAVAAAPVALAQPASASGYKMSHSSASAAVRRAGIPVVSS